MSSRLHPSLPAPVVHAGFSIPQSKSHVLAGVQDAYWSDDEAEDAECPLCSEEMDISDLNFKPCVCGYQICRFCWHHIKQNLNSRCPACRRLYTDEAVEFKPIDKEVHKRLTQQKKQRERERKELDAVGRRHLANVRVVQRSVVYVVGIGPRFAKEELIPTLRSNDYFGQYGKINKILLTKRTPSGGGDPVVGLYITFNRREDAARCIGAVDGTASPGGGRDEVMRASYGTTKYCMAFLRGINCNDHSCMNLHEWGDEKDCFTKEDLATLKHTMKATETRSRNVAGTKKGEEPEGLPRGVYWAQKAFPPISATTTPSSPSLATTRPARRGGARVTPRERPSETKPVKAERKATTTAKPSASSSRPSTPITHPLPPRPATPSDVKSATQPEKEPTEPISATLETSTTTEVEERPTREVISPPPHSEVSETSSPAVQPAAAVLSSVPSAPPGISSPSRPPRVDSASPHTPLLAAQSSYQMSNAARALLDDVTARRQNPVPADTAFSPFPDFDRTLEMLAAGGDDGSGGFKFHLDPNLIPQGEGELEEELPAPSFDISSPPGLAPFRGNFFDAFPALRPPPGLSLPNSRPRYDSSATHSPIERQPSTGSNYKGSFNPFGESNDDHPIASPKRYDSPIGDEARQMSRFGFARGRQSSNTSSPLHTSSLNLHNTIPDTHPLNTGPDMTSYNSWSNIGYQQQRSVSRLSSPLAQQEQASLLYAQHQQHQQTRFQPFDTPTSEAQLREFIQTSREQAALREQAAMSRNDHRVMQQKYGSQHQPFNDPAIMSARFASPMLQATQQLMDPGVQAHMPYGPPPGLFPPHIPTSSVEVNNVPSLPEANAPPPSDAVAPPSPVHEAPTILSSTEFPALTAAKHESASQAPPAPIEETSTLLASADAKAIEKAERKAARKAAAAERAAERQKVAEERATAKAAEKAEKARIAQEKEKAAAEKAAAERAERERMNADKLERELAQRKEREAAEKEKAARQAKEKADRETAASAKKAKAKETASTKKEAPKAAPTLTPPAPEEQAAILSKKPRKNKPIVSKPVRIQKDEDHGRGSPVLSTTASEVHNSRASNTAQSSSNNSRAQSLDRSYLRVKKEPTSVEDLLEEIEMLNPNMDLFNHPFFDLHNINPAASMPLEYGPLVHALSALSVGGGSFANNLPSGSIDNAVSSFQQLLETLTQTISDLLRLLPRTTWDDSSSFDGVLRDMLKGDDFLDEGGEEGNSGKEDEVAALTLALERRARWMEVQLSKLEELHRDINTAAVRAILSFNDNGWDRHGFLPRSGNTLKRFENIGIVEENGKTRPMTADELERRLIVAQEAVIFAEGEVKEAISKMIEMKIKPVELD